MLRPRGRFFFMEFSVTDWAVFFREIYDLYSIHVMPAWARPIAGDTESLSAILPNPIRKFPPRRPL